MNPLSNEPLMPSQTERSASDAEAIYDALWQEMVHLEVKWMQYRGLFGAGPERIALLNQAGGALMGTIQDAMWDDIIIHIGRLTDSSQTGTRSNLTVQQFDGLFLGSSIQTQIKSLIESALNASSELKKLRHKWLAHRDLKVALSPSSQPIESVSRLQIQGVLTALKELFDAVAAHIHYQPQAYALNSLDDQEVDHFLMVLHRGLAGQSATGCQGGG